VADGAHFNNPRTIIVFDTMKVGITGTFSNATFAGGVNFSFSQFGTDIQASDAHFNSPNEPVIFNTIKVAGTGDFDGATFAGPVNFAFAEFGVNFQASKAHFNNPRRDVSFSNTKVGGAGIFTRALFNGPVDFGFAQFTGSLYAGGATFNDTQTGAQFGTMKVGGSASFEGAVFAGPVDFRYADVGASFVGAGAHFNNPVKVAEFNTLKVGGAGFFQNAIFAGPADFGFARFGGNFEAQGIRFQNRAAPMDFGKCVVGGYAVFTDLSQESGLSFVNADLQFLSVDGAPQSAGGRDSSDITTLDLSGASIAHALSVSNVRLESLTAASVQVAGPATLENVSVTASVNFEHAHFANLTLNNVRWPSRRDDVHLDGIMFEHVNPNWQSTQNTWTRFTNWLSDLLGRREADHGVVIDWLNHSTFSAEPYSQAEAAFRAAGHPEMADKAFMQMKRQELRYGGLGWPGRLKSRLLYVLVGYGRHPEMAFYWSLFPLLFGWWLFRPHKMVAASDASKAANSSDSHYSAWWFSFDLLAPFINLHSADSWKPKPDWRFGRNYAMVHRILGWILIPIGLAAVTGLIK
jgi:hypothetical protein